jgi:hypothetical protein
MSFTPRFYLERAIAAFHPSLSASAFACKAAARQVGGLKKGTPTVFLFEIETHGTLVTIVSVEKSAASGVPLVIFPVAAHSVPRISKC